VIIAGIFRHRSLRESPQTLGWQIKLECERLLITTDYLDRLWKAGLSRSGKISDKKAQLLASLEQELVNNDRPFMQLADSIKG
jgi:hypothetical protein